MSLWLAMCVFLVPVAPFGPSLGSLSVPSATFGPPWVPSWLLFGKGLKIDPPGWFHCSFLYRSLQQSWESGIHPQNPWIARKLVSSTTVRALPSTRTWGQDHMSSQQSPSQTVGWRVGDTYYVLFCDGFLCSFNDFGPYSRPLMDKPGFVYDY